MSEKECRSYDFEMRAENNEEYGNFVEGRAIVFGRPYDNGWFTEYIDAGALDNTDLKDVRLLVNHDTSMIPLARSRRNNKNSTMQLTADAEGLMMRANLDTERNSQAQALYSAADRGDVTGMSFMFTIDGDKWEELDTEHPIRHITSIRKVFEVSACTFPAYENGTTFEARSASEALENAKGALENARRQAEDEAREARIKELESRRDSIRGKN